MRVASGHSQAFGGPLPLYYLLGRSGGIADHRRPESPSCPAERVIWHFLPALG